MLSTDWTMSQHAYSFPIINVAISSWSMVSTNLIPTALMAVQQITAPALEFREIR